MKIIWGDREQNKETVRNSIKCLKILKLQTTVHYFLFICIEKFSWLWIWTWWIIKNKQFNNQISYLWSKLKYLNHIWYSRFFSFYMETIRNMVQTQNRKGCFKFNFILGLNQWFHWHQNSPFWVSQAILQVVNRVMSAHNTNSLWNLNFYCLKQT